MLPSSSTSVSLSSARDAASHTWPGQILVKTGACGMCHTDLHAAEGDWPAKPTLPFIPGHEGVGLVCAIGAGVTAVKGGRRHDMAEALAFAADGKVHADIELQPLTAINEVFQRLEHGDVPSLVVIDFSGSA
jgi:D-arabinose 1-dehydrogenase-like Zn-dependent alcohol dehydrogenase